MFRRGLDKDDAWEGVVTDKKRSSPDGQNMFHRVVVALSDGSVKEIRVRRTLWNALNTGDQLGDPARRRPGRAGR